MARPPILRPGLCHTMISCGGESVVSTVTTFTTNIIGIYPTASITIIGDNHPDNGITSVTILPPVPTTTHITTSISVGQIFSTSIGNLEPGAPGTMIIIPPGPPVAATTTIISSIPGLTPTTAITVLGRPPIPGGNATVVIIPVAGERPTEWSCSCGAVATTTVTVTREPRPVPTVTTTGENGEPTTTSLSKFPCSDDDTNPCRGSALQGWQGFTVGWNAQYPRPGPPAPFITTVKFDTDGILTVTDDENKAEHFEIKLDGKLLGETYENGFDRWKYCGKDANACIAKGWSHGYFNVPKGEHELSIQWTKGDMKGWWYGAGQYRFDAACKC